MGSIVEFPGAAGVLKVGGQVIGVVTSFSFTVGDGGKRRISARRDRLWLSGGDDLRMGHADTPDRG